MEHIKNVQSYLAHNLCPCCNIISYEDDEGKYWVIQIEKLSLLLRLKLLFKVLFGFDSCLYFKGPYKDKIFFKREVSDCGCFAIDCLPDPDLEGLYCLEINPEKYSLKFIWNFLIGREDGISISVSNEK